MCVCVCMCVCRCVGVCVCVRVCVCVSRVSMILRKYHKALAQMNAILSSFPIISNDSNFKDKTAENLFY